MGTPFQSTNPWIGASQIGDALGNTIAQTAIGLPRARLEADMMRSQMQRQQIESQIAQQQAPLHSALLQASAQAQQAQALAHLGQQNEYNAHAGVYQQQMTDDQDQSRAQFELGKLAGGFVKESLENNGHVRPETAAALATGFARMHKLDPSIMENMIRTMAAATSGIGGTNQALNNAVASGTKVPVGVNVPPGNTFVNPSQPSVSPFISPVPTSALAGGQNVNSLIGSLLKAGETFGPLDNPALTNVSDRLDFLVKAGNQMRQGLATQPTNNIVPPQARKLGDKVTTQKGTFQWDGTGWQPVTNQ